MVEVDVAVGGGRVGVGDGGVVGKIWVGVGSRVGVSGPTTRVGVVVGMIVSVGSGDGTLKLGRVMVGPGASRNGVGVGTCTGGAAAKAAIPRQ